MEKYYNNVMDSINNFDYKKLGIDKINMDTVGEKVKGVVSSKLIMYLIAGVIISFIFFNVLSLLFKTPLTIVIGLILGYTMYKAQNKIEKFMNKK